MHGRVPSLIGVVSAGNSLTVRVHQPAREIASTFRPLDELDPLAIEGRGLGLVDAVASRWGTTPTAAGVYVWFELDFAEPTAV